MLEQPDILGAFRDRVRRHVAEALRQYREELRAVSADVARNGLYNSGGHLRRRADVLRKWMLQFTDQCLEDVTRLCLVPAFDGLD
jgi:hypothetical protein